jgi:glycosyltransferase involved in cell wall biosynthesis
MRILIDGGCWTNGRGYGRFTRELLGALALAPRHDYIVLVEQHARPQFSLPFPAVFVETTRPTDHAATSAGRRTLRDLLAFSGAALRISPDAVFFPSVYSYFPLIRPLPAIVGIHDTMADRFPQFAFDSRAQQRFWRWKVRLALWQCRDVLTVSQYSSTTITSYWGIPSQRIHVIPEGPAAIFRSLGMERRNMVLAVGGISPNKNLGTLIRAFAKVRAGAELVIAGDYESDGFKTCYGELAELAKDRPVRFTGRITDQELCSLYNEASVLAFPSIEEGFGLPAVEAMACGLPVVAHHGHALAEVAGDAALLVNATDEQELAGAVNRLLEDPSLAESLSARGRERVANRYSWERSAAALQDIFESIWK